MGAAADQRVAASLSLQLDQALDRGMSGGAIRIEVGRAVIALDYGDRATGLELPPENRQRLNRLGEMLQDEANEDVVERLGVERQSEDVRMPESHIGQSSRVGNLPGLGDRLIGDIDRHELRVGAPLGQRDRLGADATPNLEHQASATVFGVGVQQVDQGSG